mgnify:CR=1 FL=1
MVDLFGNSTQDDNDLTHAMSDLISFDNDEFAGDEGFLSAQNNMEDIVVYSRDWTVETVVNQIEKGNIDLNPEFQRRNAWNDVKKSSLVESYLMGYPVPEIVLAEHPRERKKYIVIDGKQRLLSLCGFLLHDKYKAWKTPKLKGLRDLTHLNTKSFHDLKQEPRLNQYVRILANSDVRCTVISNVKNDDVLYDIFYRLNAGATPLSMQELRQVLYSGPFAKFLIDYTSSIKNIHHTLRLDKPDNRLKDVETILRLLAMINNLSSYNGNLKKHLDEFTLENNELWDDNSERIKSQLQTIDESIELMAQTLGGFEYIGRKWNGEKTAMDTRFNTVLFEVQIYFAYFGKLAGIPPINQQKYLESFIKLCEDPTFNASISSSTKNSKEYEARYVKYQRMYKNLTGKVVSIPWN